MAEENSRDQISTLSRKFSAESFALESFRYVPNADEKSTANVSGQQPSLNTRI